ncbi:MAG: response regulator transcription factor [Dehalococcoidia bacterium]
MGHLIAAQLRELCPRSSITLSEDQNTVLSPGDVLVACTDTDRSLVVFGQSPAPHVVEMCLARGVWSMVTVDSPSEEFSVAVRTLVDGPSFVASSIVRALASAAVGAIQGNEHLTPREYEVLTLLADGLSNAEIANELCVSPNTVRTHVQSLFTKLEVGSRAKVVARARAAGLIP